MSKEELNLDEADLPVLRKKYLAKVIAFPIISVLCIIWTIFAIINYDSYMLSDVWNFVIPISLVIAPIAGMVFLSLTMKNSGLLRKVIHKQKGIEPKDKEKYYGTPDPETITFFKKKSKRGFYYLQILTLISILFTIFYIVVYKNEDSILRLANFFDDTDTSEWIFDIFLVLGYIAGGFCAIIVVISLFTRSKIKGESKEKKYPLNIFKSLRTKSESVFSRTESKNVEEPPEEPYDSEEIFDVKSYRWSNDIEYWYNLIWSISYVIGIPLKIFLPIYLLPLTIEISLVDHIFNFVFWAIFLGIFISYLIEFVPVWKTIRKLENKTDGKLE